MDVYKTITITSNPDFMEISADAGDEGVSIHAWGRLKELDGIYLSNTDAKALIRGIQATMKKAAEEEKNL